MLLKQEVRVINLKNKVILLKKSFFLVSLSTDLSNINRYTYLEKLLYINIISREVEKAIL